MRCFIFCRPRCRNSSKARARDLRGDLAHRAQIHFLLRQTGQALGLGRFEANLILAIEHNREHPVALDSPSRNWLPVNSLLLFAGIQSVLIAAAWWVIRL